MKMFSQSTVQLYSMWGYPVSGITMIVKNDVLSITKNVIQIASVSLIRGIYQIFW